MRMIPISACRTSATRTILSSAFASFAVLAGAQAACLSTGDGGLAEARALVESNPVYRLEGYAFDPATPLHRRVGPAPEAVLAYVRDLDGRPDYRPYRPTAAEARLIRRSLDRLPPRIKRNLERRGLGIYFIDDFLTSGMTDWAIASTRPDEGPARIYSYMIFHAKTLKTSMQAILNQRERTCFRDDASGVRVRIRVDGGENAFTYLLMHEAVHALDYSERISPYVESTVRPFQESVPRDAGAGDFIDRVWSDYREPRSGFDFPGRERVTFYGFRGGPKLSLAEAPEIYRGLAKSPFVSLYGSQMWPEDLAELVSMYYLTDALGRDYSIEIERGGESVAKFHPMRFPKVRERTRELSRHFE